jgi:uncharacterized coiled-coil protein SlyX
MALRDALSLVFIIFLISSVSALSISVDSPIPQGVGWSFSVDLGSLNNVDSAKIYVGGELAVEVFEFSGNKYVDESSISSKVFDYSLNGNIITISYSAKSEGTVQISVKTFLDGSEQDSTSVDVVFFIPLDQATKSELVNKINTLENTITSQTSTISGLQSKLSIKDDEVDFLTKQNASLLNSINSMQTNIESLELGGKTTEEQLIVLKSDLNTILVEQEASKRNNPLNVLMSFNDNTNGLAAGAVVVLILLVVVAVVIRNNGDSIYSGLTLPKFDSPFKGNKDSGADDSESTYKDTHESDIDEQAEEMFRGKWAFMDEEAKK